MIIPKTGKPRLHISPLEGRVKAFAELRFSEIKPPKTLGFDENSLSVSLYKKFKKKSKLFPAAATIKKPREIKDAQEIMLMEKAANIVKKTLKSVNVFGKQESKVARDIEHSIREQGAEPAFETIVASGRNAGNRIHHAPIASVVRKQDLTIIDLGARFQGYCSDITRTHFLKRDKKQRQLWETVLAIQQECIDLAQPGTELKEINNHYKKTLQKKGSRPRHWIGHGIGLDVHEPVSTLKKGMIITIEPGIYLKNYGGCRIEDMIIIQKNKAKVLSHSIPLLVVL